MNQINTQRLLVTIAASGILLSGAAMFLQANTTHVNASTETQFAKTAPVQQYREPVYVPPSDPLTDLLTLIDSKRVRNGSCDILFESTKKMVYQLPFSTEQKIDWVFKRLDGPYMGRCNFF
jgi:hypothetical protein